MAALIIGCQDIEVATKGGCERDQDCEKDQKCVVAAGVCVGFTTPLTAPDGGTP